MAYGRDFAGSARRHLAAAQLLIADTRPGKLPGSKAVAGYLFGLAGELAFKQRMAQRGIKQLPPDKRRDDPFYAHFPTLKTLVLNSAGCRRHTELLRRAQDPKLFSNWDTDMRYAPTSDIKEEWTDAWKDQAQTLVSEMDL